MFTFSAVIYDGNKQNLVKFDARTESDFDAYLQSRFGCYVCLWSNKELSASTISMIANSQSAQLCKDAINNISTER
ncbi:hypothetical protein MTsDn1_14220 [Alteromonas sp. MTD1]|uniref:hypothetical protein n=1 Tax=Alteromonas sp. MTD1 TaxID=3057962 RepID=UPI0036F211A0